MRNSTRVLCLGLAGLLCSPGPCTWAGSKGKFRSADSISALNNLPFLGKYQVNDEKTDGCYGVIHDPSLPTPMGGQEFVLALLDPLDRPGGCRWVGFPLVKQLPFGEDASPDKRAAEIIRSFAEGKIRPPFSAAGPTLAGKIELKPAMKRSRGRRGTLKIVLVYKTSGPDRAWVRLPEEDQGFPCDLAPDPDEPAPGGDGSPSASPPGEGWDFTLGPLLASQPASPAPPRRRTAFVRKEGAGWTLVFKGPGEDTTPHRCYVDVSGETVEIRCSYKKGDGAELPYVGYRFSGTVSEDGGTLRGSYWFRTAKTEAEFKKPVPISGYFDGKRHEAADH